MPTSYREIPSSGFRELGSESRSPLSFYRPTLITVICGYFFISWILVILQWAIIFSTSPHYQLTFPSYSWLVLMFTVASIIGIFGYWFMRRAGVILYIFSAIVLLFYSIFFSGRPALVIVASLLLPSFIAIVGLYYFKRMR